MKQGVIKYNKILLSILIGFSFLFLFNRSVINSLEDNPLKFAYGGEWYSKGFGSFWSWKGFVETVIETVSKFTIIEKDNTFGLSLSGFNTSYFGNYNPNTGEMSGSLNFSGLPSGEGKVFSGKILVNGESDLRKFGNPRDYINKSIKQLILDGIKNKWRVSFVGTKSKTELSPGPNATVENPVIMVNYEKYQGSDTSAVPLNYEIEGSENINIENYSVENITEIVSNIGNVSNISTNENQTIQNQTEIIQTNLSIINPKPSYNNVSIFVNETKTFSIENTDYDSIKWYLDEKDIKRNSKSYTFKGLKQGFNEIKVEVKKASEIKSYGWSVEVKEREIIKEKGINWMFWIIIGVTLIIIIMGILYFLKSKRNNQLVNGQLNN